MRWRPLAIVILVVFGAGVGLWSLSSFDDHVPLAIPPELEGQVEAESVRFTCAAPLRSASVTPSEAAANREFPLERPPCEEIRDERRLLTGIDVLVVVVGLLFLTFVRTSAGGSPDGQRPAESEPKAPISNA